MMIDNFNKLERVFEQHLWNRESKRLEEKEDLENCEFNEITCMDVKCNKPRECCEDCPIALEIKDVIVDIVEDEADI
ncbi:MAG: hypothetical protein WC554_04250 [Clostridia bacterium]